MKNAVVTGGGSGIGAAVAHRLRADGLHVATIDLNPGRGEVLLHRRRHRPRGGRCRAEGDPRRARSGHGARQRRGPGPLQAVRRPDVRRLAEGHRRQPQRRLPLHPGGAAGHDRGRLGTHRQHLVVEHPLGAAVHVPVRRGQVRGQRPDEVTGAGVRARRNHRQRGSAGFHRHPDAAQGGEARLPR